MAPINVKPPTLPDWIPLRVNVRILGPFTLAHLVSLALVIVGLGILATSRASVRSS